MNEREKSDKRLQKNKYGVPVKVRCHGVGELMVTNDGGVYRVMSARDVYGFPCRPTVCAFSSANGACSKPDGVEPCTLLNRDDDENIFFVKVGNVYEQKETIEKMKRQMNVMKKNEEMVSDMLDKKRAVIAGLVKSGLVEQKDVDKMRRKMGEEVSDED